MNDKLKEALETGIEAWEAAEQQANDQLKKLEDLGSKKEKPSLLRMVLNWITGKQE
ncbi:hypothetical protein [Novispirillum itersonii]|uniref:hypothetical protein n=1 Tax=Novispirillum itersonii TaxID=189 RepID=UPI0003A3C82D|nr:hypothetical protein [Novispirillum itersonii]